jgi:multidrug efflux pump subunit AcrA (membrane-fusion protein)
MSDGTDYDGNPDASARTANAVAGWQKLSEERGQQLADERARNSQLETNLTELQERLEALELQAQSGEPERTPIVNTNNPLRPFRNKAIEPNSEVPSEWPDWWKRSIRNQSTKR